MGKLPKISDYVSLMDTPQLLKASILKNGHVVRRGDKIIRYAGGFCVVFPFQTPMQKYAVRCWHTNVADSQERTRKIAQDLSQLHLPYFVRFEYFPEGVVTNEGIQPMVVMDWVDAQPLKAYIGHFIKDGNILRALANSFLSMVKDLHTHSLSHGDLQHGNILVKNSGEIVLVDYDSMYVPSLEGFTDEIKGLEGYQHKLRWTNKKLTPKADYFSELVIYTSLMALAKYPQLWEDLNMEDTETLLFSAEDIDSEGTSPIFSILDADDELAFLSNSLKDFMHCRTLNDLLPLEEVLRNPVDGISTKWGDNGYRPPVIDNSSLIDNISSTWNVRYHQSQHSSIAESITKKW